MFVQCISSLPSHIRFLSWWSSEQNISSYAAMRRLMSDEMMVSCIILRVHTQPSTLCHSDDKKCREKARHVWCFRPCVSQEEPQHSWPFPFSLLSESLSSPSPRASVCVDVIVVILVVAWLCPAPPTLRSPCPGVLSSALLCSAPQSLLSPCPGSACAAYLSPINYSQDVTKIARLRTGDMRVEMF